MTPATEHHPAAEEQELLQVVTDLVRELHPSRQVPVTPTSSLERDLAIDSLGRLELLGRLERRLGVVFPEEAALVAERPLDLLRLARAAGVRAAAEAALPPPSPLEGLPREAQTLPDVLRWHAARHPDRLCVRMLHEEREGALSYGQLLTDARRVAAGLRALGCLPGESVGIMLPSGLDYFRTFHGVLLAGAVPVPIYPPHRPAQLEEHVRRQVRILDNAQARLLVTTTATGRLGPLLRAHLPGLRAAPSVDQLRASAAEEEVARGPGDVALLQYTSGSTGDPKGVVLTHANLLANLRAMGEAVGACATDVFVSWLPLYHDMGLIGACLGTLYYGCPLVLMSPTRFLTRPQRWLETIHRHGGTLSAAPNFAYEICATRLDDEALAGLDLSSWRIAFNGAERVSPETLRRFSERFAPYGFRPETLLPVYGLAESSVGLAFPRPGRPPRVDRVRREPFLRQRRAEPAADEDPQALSFACCGQPIPGHELRVVDEQGHELGDREEGRLQFRGPSATSGYHHNPAATAALFAGEWLESGDRAYMADGELYVTGRSKDLIIKAGRNLYPEELESVVGELPGIRKGCVAAFGALDPRQQTERLVILAETRETDPTRLEELRRQVQAAVDDLLGLQPDEVVLAPPRTVLKTSSGKIRRAACRQLYEQGELGAQRAVWWQVTRLALSGVVPWLRRQRRALLARLYGAWVWAVVGLLTPLVWLGIPLLPRRAWRRSLTRGAIRLALLLSGIRVRVHGRQHLAEPGPRVFVANHASYLDGFLLAALLPSDGTLAIKGELAGNPLVSWHLRLLGHVFVERLDPRRGRGELERLAAVVERGESPVLFAESTFVRAPGLRPFHMGAFLLAGRTGVPVVPVAIRGARSVLRGDQWFPRRGAIDVTVLRSLSPHGEAWAEALRLRDEARAAILAHCGEPDLGREPVPIPGSTP